MTNQLRKILSPETAEHHELYGARMAGDRLTNEVLAPFEHRAFAREYVEQNPISGPLAMLVLTSGYTPAKALGLTQSDEKTTPASVAQMIGGYTGIGEGVVNNLRKWWNR